MYQYPYGNAQQLNLDWILSKIQELEADASEVNIEEVANTLISASFDAGVSYRRYDYCFYNGKLYRALNDNSGAFNPADWLEVVIGDDIPVLTRLLNAVDTSLTSLQNTVNDLDSDDIDNASLVVSGATVTDALGTLNSAITTEATTRAGADTALQNTLNNIGTIITGEYLTDEIPNSQVVDTMSVTLTNGTWIIFGYFNYGASFTTGRALSYLLQGSYTLSQLNNDNGAPGGGAFPLSTLVVITDNSPSKTIRLAAYQSSGAQQTITTRRLNAVRIK